MSPPSPAARSTRRRWLAAWLGLALTAGGGSARAGALPLSLEDPASGGPVALEAGAVALHLVFFATWCPPCRAELAELAELETRWDQDGYRLVLIAVRSRHSAPRLVEFATNERPPGRVLFDADGRAQRALGAEHLPTHVVFDRQGNEVVRSGALGGGIEAEVERLVRGAVRRGGH